MQSGQPRPIPEQVARILRVVRKYDPEVTYGALVTGFGDEPCHWSFRWTNSLGQRVRTVVDNNGNTIKEEVV